MMNITLYTPSSIKQMSWSDKLIANRAVNRFRNIIQSRGEKFDKTRVILVERFIILFISYLFPYDNDLYINNLNFPLTANSLKASHARMKLQIFDLQWCNVRTAGVRK